MLCEGPRERGTRRGRWVGHGVRMLERASETLRDRNKQGRWRKRARDLQCDRQAGCYRVGAHPKTTNLQRETGRDRDEKDRETGNG